MSLSRAKELRQIARAAHADDRYTDAVHAWSKVIAFLDAAIMEAAEPERTRFLASQHQHAMFMLFTLRRIVTAREKII